MKMKLSINKWTLILSALVCVLILIAILLGSKGFQKASQATPTAITTPIAVFTNTATILPFTATPEPSQTPSPTPQPEPPPETFYIESITGHRQVYSLGCEAGASVDWARFFGTSFYEFDFQNSLPLSDNPDYGFVGDVNSEWGQIPPYAYGVHAGPVADLLQKYGLPAKAVTNFTIDEVKRELSEGDPIIVWVIGNMVWSQPVQYTDKENRTTIVAPYEHVVILTGYNKDSIRYMTNGRFYDTPTDVFLTSWGVLGNMAVIYDN
jgi:uncharacterized protein YvpB